MNRLVLLLICMLFLIGCRRQSTAPDSTFEYREVVTDYDSTHENYRLYGIYKMIKIYNVKVYKDSSYHTLYIDDNHFMGYFLNEFGDTITKKFVDTSNYPRRGD